MTFLSHYLSGVYLAYAVLLLSSPSGACQSETPDPSLLSPSRTSEGLIAMEAHQVVPDVIPAAPASVLKVTYPGGVEAAGGAELTPTQVKDAPQLSWDADPDALYTVVMTDPDAPSRADSKFAEWRHWLVVDVPGTDTASGDTVTAYVGPAPPRGSGLHRYVLLVYKQPGKLTVDAKLRKTKHQAKGRKKWSVRKFAEQHFLGTPVAGNLFQAQWDDYVPRLYKQFTD